MEIVWIAGLLIFGLIGAAIGSSKGSAGLGFVLGALLGPLGWILIWALCTMSGKKCPACAELVKEEATICKHCRQPLSPGDGRPSSRRGPFVT